MTDIIIFDSTYHKVEVRLGEMLKHIYIGRRFKNDTERLEKLFELYTKMTAQRGTPTSLPIKTRKSNP